MYRLLYDENIRQGNFSIVQRRISAALFVYGEMDTGKCSSPSGRDELFTLKPNLGVLGVVMHWTG